MQILFDGVLHVQYGQAGLYVGDVDGSGAGEAFDGQANGLLGVASPGLAWLRFATHTGDVACRVESHPSAPDLDDDWEDVVEASVLVDDGPVALVGLMEEPSAEFHVPSGDYRVRFCSRGRDAARVDEQAGHDSYLLQLWPAPVAEDEVLRQGSDDAAYWHREARGVPHPSRPNADLESLVLQAPPDVRHRVLSAAVDRALLVCGLADEPAVVRARSDADQIATTDVGYSLDDYPQIDTGLPGTGRMFGTPQWQRRREADSAYLLFTAALWKELETCGRPSGPDNLVWRRFHAAEALSKLLWTAGTSLGDRRSNLAWDWCFSLEAALGDEWPEARAQLERDLA